MIENQDFRPESVIGPLGELLTLEALPPSDLSRWTPRRKAEVVSAVRGGLLTVGETCARYEISHEEFESWQQSVERSGMLGLRATRFQHYRDKYKLQDYFQSRRISART